MSKDERVKRPSWWRDTMGDDWQPMRFTVRYTDLDGNVTIKEKVSAYYFPEGPDKPPSDPFSYLLGAFPVEDLVEAEWLTPEEASVLLDSKRTDT
jgi:hypothetical protein